MNDRGFEDLRKEKKLLIAASDPRLVRIAVRFYQRRGFQTCGAHSTRETLALAKEKRPQVVLLAATLDTQSVAFLIEGIKRIDPDCNVILFAREEDSELIKNAWRSGAFFFLKQGAKPREISPEIDRAFEDYFGRIQIRYQRKFVIVLMPFAPGFKPVYDLGIKAAVMECGLVCERIDEQHFTESILERVLAQIRRARFVVADITGNNPNVLFEAGYAHALAKSIIFCTRDPVETIPFDLRHMPHIVYKDDSDYLRQQLLNRLTGLVEQRVGLEE